MGLSAPLVDRSHLDLAGRLKERRKVCMQGRDLLDEHVVYINSWGHVRSGDQSVVRARSYCPHERGDCVK